MTDRTDIQLPPTGTRMTAAEYADLPETNKPIQLLAGEIVVSPPPVPDHQRVILRFVFRLDTLIPDGELFVSPIGLYLDEGNVPEPDIVWVAANSRCVVTDKWLEGPPDLIVEVLSPSTARYDRTVKFTLYERYGVREYWLADPAAEYVEVFVLQAGKFVRQGAYGPEDSFQSPVLGKTVDLSGIFAGG
jgi:Uma2 family endonuclease